jgi:starvation-inducible DNA-binding protein
VSKVSTLQAPPALVTPTDLSQETVREISAALNHLLADSFALYLKTKNFHWHVSGQHFRDYHLLLDEQVQQILTTTDELAERVRKIGRSAAPPCAPLVISSGIKASRITTKNLSPPRTCCAS